MIDVWRQKWGLVIDQLIDWIEDAASWIPARLHLKQVDRINPRQVENTQGRVRVELDMCDVFVAALEIKTAERTDAEQAFRLQKDRLVPLDPAGVTAALAENDQGQWSAAMVQHSVLDTIRDRASRGTKVDAFEVNGPGGECYVLRGDKELSARRRHMGGLMLALALIAVSALVFSDALAGRTARQLVLVQYQRRVSLGELRAENARVDALIARPVQQTLPFDRAVSASDALAAVIPDDWAAVSLQIVPGRITTVLSQPAQLSGDSLALTRSMEGQAQFEGVELQTLGSVNGLVRTEFSMSLSEPSQ
jgi:hypothetical protein